MLIVKELKRGVFAENPVFRLLLGLCPLLAVTTSAINGVGMGLATLAVLLGSNVVVSALKNFIPKQVRIPCYIVIISTFVTLIAMFMEAFTYGLYEALGIFIPLIVVNCIILGRAEAFASTHSMARSALDAVAMGLGFTLSLTLLGAVREILGSGSIFGISFVGERISMPAIFVLPPGAFITMGLLLALFNGLSARRRKTSNPAVEKEG